VADWVENEVLEGEELFDRTLPPAEKRAHSRDELLQSERFGEVVVCAGVEPFDAIGERIARSQEQDR
jgi:hypothetical protein